MSDFIFHYFIFNLSAIIVFKINYFNFSFKSIPTCLVWQDCNDFRFHYCRILDEAFHLTDFTSKIPKIWDLTSNTWILRPHRPKTWHLTFETLAFDRELFSKVLKEALLFFLILFAWKHEQKMFQMEQKVVLWYFRQTEAHKGPTGS